MELWSMAAKGFPAIFSTGNSDSASFSYELPYKGNVSSNDNDEYLQVTRTEHIKEPILCVKKWLTAICKAYYEDVLIMQMAGQYQQRNESIIKVANSALPSN